MQNIVNARSQRTMGAHAVPHTGTEHNDLRFHTEAGLRSIARKLEATAGEGVKSKLAEMEAVLGYNYSPHGILFNDRWLRIACPSVHAAFDWMHCYFVNGILCSRGIALTRGP